MNTEKQEQLLEKADDILSRINNKNSDWYGGMYLSDDKLVILSTVENNSLLSEFLDDDILVKTAEYNYDHLVEVQQEICDKLYEPDDSLKATGLPERFVLCAIFEDQNRVTVAFEDFTEDDIPVFKKFITDSEAVTLTSGQKSVCDVSIHPSDILSCNGYFSMGYAAETNATFFPKKGFVTCGHFKANKNDPIRQASDESIVGKVSQKLVDMDLGIDACFAESAENITADNFINAGTGTDITITRVTNRYLVSASVTMYGGVSGEQSGIIKSTQCNLHDMKDAVLCKYKSKEGDSGSPILISNTGKLVGIQRGDVNYGGKQHGVVIKAKNINDEFHLVLSSPSDPDPDPGCCIIS